MTGFRPVFVDREPHHRGRRGDEVESPQPKSRVRILAALLWGTVLGTALCVCLNVRPVARMVGPLKPGSDAADLVCAGLARLSLSLACLALVPVATGGVCGAVAMIGRKSAASWWPVVYAVIIGCGALGAVEVARFGLGALVTEMPIVAALVFWGAAFSRQTVRGIAGVARFLSATVVVFAVAGFVLIRSATIVQAAEADPIQMTVEDKERLDTIQETLSRDATEGGGVELELVERDLQLVFSRWLSQSDLPISGEISIPSDDVRVSLMLPVPGWSGRQLAVHADLRPMLNAEVHEFRLQFDRLQLGAVPMPQAVSCACAGVFSNLASDSAPISRMLGCLDSMVVTRDGLALSGSLDTAVVSDVLQGGSVNAGLVAQVRDCGRHLLAHSAGLPEGDARLEAMMTLAFEWARTHSGSSGSAVEANRAVLITLAVVVGSNAVSQIMASQKGEALPRFEYGFYKFITVHDRRDLAQHLVASAGLAAWASQTTSETAGLLKEEWDSVGDGSGFSFADLAADRAGARLGLLATVDEETAHRVQVAFADGMPLRSYMPSVTDLPEGISQELFEQEYGGVNGERFRQLDREIDRRLAALPAFE